MVKMVEREEVDVVIVGAGAAGSAYAGSLSARGKKVVLLEQGPDWKASDLVSSDIWGRRLKPFNSSFILEGEHRVSLGYHGGWGVGGAALHYFGGMPRMLPTDFRVKSDFGRGHDWPIGYEDLAPWYDRVAQTIGISGDANAEAIWRPKGEQYPMPPLKTFKSGQVWLEALKARNIRTVPAPLAINSVIFKGRPPCIYDGWCHVGCPTGALANPIVTFLAEARRFGAEVRARCTATRIVTNRKGSRVLGVEYVDHDQKNCFQPARVVILAAWAAQNPRLLLMSATDKHTAGLANANGLVGKYLMTHFASTANALFDEDIESYKGTTAGQYASYDRYAKDSHGGACFGSTYITVGTAVKASGLAGVANARPELFGPELAAFMRRAMHGLARYTAFGEEQPKLENRVELASSRDDLGLPKARLIHSYDANETALWNANLEEGMEVAKLVGAAEYWPSRGAMPTNHLMGGTIMGDDPASSVVDSFGQTHEIPNLYIAGPGIFATAGAVNPTNTVFAVTMRSAEKLLERWESIVA
jgi:choline dehydrogenase-like flavoprotein